jgi:hypothetical protein
LGGAHLALFSSKTENNYFYKLVSEINFAPIVGLEKLKSFYPNVWGGGGLNKIRTEITPPKYFRKIGNVSGKGEGFE